MTANSNALLEVISDVVCPWCYIGKHRLDQALATLAPNEKPRVVWKPYELNPNVPTEGRETTAHYVAKFGSEHGARQLIANVTANAHNDGLEMDYAAIARVPNTIEAHRLIWFAAEHEQQNKVVDALFRAYFVTGEYIGDRAILVDIGARCGLNRAALESFLASDEALEIVRTQAKDAHRAGVQGVPAFVYNGHLLFSGAQSPETVALSLKRAHAKGL